MAGRDTASNGRRCSMLAVQPFSRSTQPGGAGALGYRAFAPSRLQAAPGGGRCVCVCGLGRLGRLVVRPARRQRRQQPQRTFFAPACAANRDRMPLPAPTSMTTLPAKSAGLLTMACGAGGGAARR